MTDVRPWHALPDGAVVDGPSVTVTEALVDHLVTLGGFVHPLFTEREFVEQHSPFPSRPLPGTAALHLLAGLAEQTGVLDDTLVALVGLEEVRFMAPVLVGDVLALRLTRVGTQPTRRSGQRLLRTRWEGLCLTPDTDDLRLTATALFLVRE